MSEVLFAACFFRILFVPCVLATRSVSDRGDREEPSEVEVIQPRQRTLPQGVMRVAHPGKVVAAPVDDGTPSGDFGDLQHDYDLHQQRLMKLCGRPDRAAHRVA